MCIYIYIVFEFTSVIEQSIAFAAVRLCQCSWIPAPLSVSCKLGDLGSDMLSLPAILRCCKPPKESDRGIFKK